jgi:2-hydroxychromene-2-carboxylate isomerase
VTVGTDGRSVVDFYFDPACPWAWRTSLWIQEAARVRPIELRWRCLSLEEINRPLGALMEVHATSRAPFRTLVLARRRGGERAIGRLYAALGAARHARKQDLGDPATVTTALAEAGLDVGLYAEALADPTTEGEYLAEHAAIAERGAFGVPTLVIDGSAPIFGPVLHPAPEGEAAGALYDHVAALTRIPAFFELKRSRK